MTVSVLILLTNNFQVFDKDLFLGSGGQDNEINKGKKTVMKCINMFIKDKNEDVHVLDRHNPSELIQVCRKAEKCLEVIQSEIISFCMLRCAHSASLHTSV